MKAVNDIQMFSENAHIIKKAYLIGLSVRGDQ